MEGYEMIVVDSGDFSTLGSKHGEFKTEWMIRGMSEMGYDAVAVGEKELQMGRARMLELASKYSLPLVCANVVDAESQELLVDPYVILEVEKKSLFGLLGRQVKVGIFGVLSPRYLTPVSVRGEAPLKATDPVRAAEAVIKKLQEEGCSVIVALAHVSVPEAGQIASVGGLTAIVMGHSMAYTADPRFDNGAIVIQGGREGRNIGDVKIDVGPGGEVVSIEGEVLPLTNKYKDDPHFAALISEYKKNLEVMAFAPKVTKDQGMSLYVGKTACGSCHADQLEQWKSTNHSTAFATLVENNSHYDPDCVGCHVLGYGRGNGFRDAGTTPAMADVQCESCHGPGLDHFRYHSSDGKSGSEAEAAMPPVVESVCTECHKDDHDPEFDFEKKVVAVIH